MLHRSKAFSFGLLSLCSTCRFLLHHLLLLEHGHCCGPASFVSRRVKTLRNPQRIRLLRKLNRWTENTKRRGYLWLNLRERGAGRPRTTCSSIVVATKTIYIVQTDTVWQTVTGCAALLWVQNFPLRFLCWQKLVKIHLLLSFFLSSRTTKQHSWEVRYGARAHKPGESATWDLRLLEKQIKFFCFFLFFSSLPFFFFYKKLGGKCNSWKTLHPILCCCCCCFHLRWRGFQWQELQPWLSINPVIPHAACMKKCL